MKMFLAEDIMTKVVESTSPSSTLSSISKKMARKEISCILVVENRKPVGIISERDFVKKVLSHPKKEKILAKDIMSSPVLSIKPKETVSNAAKLMSDNKIRHILVTDNNSVKGIITETDVLRGETEYIKAHQFLQNLILALFITILLLFVIVFRVL